MLEKKLVWAIKFLIYASFIMPLIVMGNTFIFPFVFPKAIFFRILVELMLGFYLLLCLINKNYWPQKKNVFWSVLIWATALLLASIFGTDFIRSFWGNYERMSGWFTLVHFALYFMIVSATLKTWEEWRNLFRWGLLWSFFVGLTGLNFLLSPNSIMRIGGGGSLGNQIYIANYILFFIFIAGYLLKREEKKLWKFFSAAYIIIGTVLMLYNGKRGPFIGLVAGIFIAAFLYSLLTKVKKWRIIGLSIISILIVCGGLIFVFRQTNFVEEIPVIGAIAQTNLSSGTAETRLIAWGIAWQAFKERPVFGWGVENFYYAFDKYYNPKSLEHGYYETWFDRSHNIFMDYLSTTGIVGFLAYLSIFASCFWVIFKAYKKKVATSDTVVFLSVFLVGYAVQNVFVFDHLSSYLVFFLILAFVNWLEQVEVITVPKTTNKEIRQKEIKNKKLSAGHFLGIGLLILVLIYTTNIKPAKANNADLTAQKNAQQNFSGVLSQMQSALEIDGQFHTDMRNDFARVILSYSQNQQLAQSSDYAKALVFAIEQMKTNVREHPLELQSYITLSQLYAIGGDLTNAETVLTHGQTLSPKRQQIAYLLVRLKGFKKDYSGALTILKQTLADDDKIADTYWYLGLIYNDLGDKKQAFENVKKSVDLGKTFSINQEFYFAGKILLDGGELKMAQNVFEQVLAKDQNDTTALAGLAQIYEKLGDKDKAKEMLLRLSAAAVKK